MRCARRTTPSGGVLPALVIDCDCDLRRVSRDERAGAAAGPAGAPQPAGRRAAAAVRGAARWARSTPAGAPSAFTCCRRSREAGLVELTRSESSSPVAAARAERFFGRSASTSRGSATRPGLVLGRIVCQLINESAFALGEGVGARARHRHRAWCSA